MSTGAILIASTRAAGGVYTDTTGPFIAAWLEARGWAVEGPLVVADGPAVGEGLAALLAGGPELIVTSGGTGIHPGDRTPDQTRALLDYEIPGFSEELRRRGGLKIASALLSRGVAGVAGSTIVVNLPGSSGGVKDGLGLLDEVLDHMLEQVRGATMPGETVPTEPPREGVDASTNDDPKPAADPAARQAAAPPASAVAFARVSAEPITLDECIDAVSGDSAGAVVSFSGVVRDHDHGRGVVRLGYTGHPTADAVMKQIAADIAAAHPAVTVAVAHRVGDLGIGDVALACAVSSAHRGEAFAACQALVDEVKLRVPIWKEQLFTDGTSEWVGAA